MTITRRPAEYRDIKNEEPRTANVIKMIAVAAEAIATSATARPLKFVPALASLSARLAIWPHLSWVKREWAGVD